MQPVPAPLPAPGPLARRPRLAAVDVARGAAVAAMIAYHLAWDLSFLRLVEVDVGAHPVGRWAARAIAGSFLVLVGVGLVLGHGRTFRARAFLRRLAVVAGAALLVTGATLLAFPDRYIFFGILHCIAASSVLALPFLRAPAPLTLAAAALAVAAPHWLASPALDRPWLLFLGLSPRPPLTNDFVPLLPWFGLVLLGVALGRVGAPRLLTAQDSARGAGALARALAWAGRRSLPVYLLHQPVLLGVLWLVLQATGPSPAAERADLGRFCRAVCAQGGREAGECDRACACVVEGAVSRRLVRQALEDSGTERERAEVSAMARTCFGVPARPE